MLATSHADMGRFASASDPNLACIVACLKRLCTDPKDTAQLGSPPLPSMPPSSDMWADRKYAVPVKPPFPRNVHFCGREAILGQIHAAFWPDSSLLDDCSRPLARACITLCGAAGSGKTQLLLEYLYRHAAAARRPAYSSVFWLNAASPHTLAASAYAAVDAIIAHYDALWRTQAAQAAARAERIAHALGIFEASITSHASLMRAVNRRPSVPILARWLAHQSNARWLLVLDNYDPDVDLQALLPAASPAAPPAVEYGHVLVATRTYNPYPGTHSIPVPNSIGEPESIDLLVQSSGKGLKISRNGLSAHHHHIHGAPMLTQCQTWRGRVRSSRR